jgi:hypothetical protein
LIEPEVLKSMPWTLLDELAGGTIFAPHFIIDTQ